MADEPDNRGGEHALPFEQSTTVPGFQETHDASPTDIRDGREIYLSLREALESEYYGSYVMIDTRTGQYVLGATTSEVHAKFLERFGIDAPGWCTRIGVSVFATA